MRLQCGGAVADSVKSLALEDDMRYRFACVFLILLILFAVVVIASWVSDTRVDQAETNAVVEVSEPSIDDIQSARVFLQDGPSSGYEWKQPSEWVPREIERKKADEMSLIRGAIALLRDGTNSEKCHSLDFLSAFGDKIPSQPFLQALSSSNSWAVRDRAIVRLPRRHLADANVMEKLVDLRDNDPAISVRVTAALAVGNPGDAKSVAVFEKGLTDSASDNRTRQSCEDELEGIGKLNLPLPDEIYFKIDERKYHEIAGDPQRYKVRKKTMKGGFIYLEVLQVEHHKPESSWLCSWYRFKE
jgi:HEAT repeat protein